MSDPDQPATLPSAECIVLIDDDAIVRLLAGGVLLKAGFRVEAHSDGESALAFIHGGARVDLVLTDWMMPKVGGLEVLQSLKSNPATAAIPAIVMTGSLDGDVASTVAEAGANAWIEKPIKAAALADLVRGVLDGAKRA
jgi:CheY-like chemotaxis protein